MINGCKPTMHSSKLANRWVNLMRRLYKWSNSDCKHEFDYLKDMTNRNSDGMVSCVCHKCKVVFWAECGLDLPGTLVQLKKRD